MTPDQFRACLEAIGWTQRGLAERLSCNERGVRRWADGSAAIPPAIAAWLMALASAHELHPAPQDWKRRAA